MAKLEKNVVIDPSDVEKLKTFEEFAISYSGGKDSMGILLWAKNELTKYIPDLMERTTVIYFHMRDIECPEVEDFLLYTEIVCGVKILRIPTPMTFEDNAMKLGFPSRFNTWCEYGMKFKCMDELYDERGWTKNKKFLALLGIRGWESHRRAKQGAWRQNVYRGTDAFAPIYTWKENFLLDYIRKSGMWLIPTYMYAPRTSCFICPNSKPKDVAMLRKYRPELYKEWPKLFRKLKDSEVYQKNPDFYVRDVNKYLIESKKFHPAQLTLNKAYTPYMNTKAVAETIRKKYPDYKFKWSGFEKALRG